MMTMNMSPTITLDSIIIQDMRITTTISMNTLQSKLTTEHLTKLHLRGCLTLRGFKASVPLLALSRTVTIPRVGQEVLRVKQAGSPLISSQLRLIRLTL